MLRDRTLVCDRAIKAFSGVLNKYDSIKVTLLNVPHGSCGLQAHSRLALGRLEGQLGQPLPLSLSLAAGSLPVYTHIC